MLEPFRQQWRCFRDDRPGQRFQNHLQRVQRHSGPLRILSLALGVVLLAGGVVLLFIPGPGLLLILFGAALFAGESQRLARLLDRAEPRARQMGHRLLTSWRAASMLAKVALVLAVLAAAAAAAYGAWMWFVR